MTKRLVFGTPEATELRKRDLQAADELEQLQQEYPDLEEARLRVREIDRIISDYRQEIEIIESDIFELETERADIERGLEILADD